MEKTIHLLIMYTMLVLTLLLFHKGRKHPRSLMLACYASVEVLTNGLNSLTLVAGFNFFERFPFSHFIYKPLYCLWVPMFYLYCRYCFSINFKLKKKQLIHFIPFTAFLVFFFLILTIKGNHYIWENLYKEGSFVYMTSFAIDVIVKIQYLIYNFLMISLLLKTDQKLKHNELFCLSLSVDIKWLRFIVYGYAVGCLGGIVYWVSIVTKSQAASIINIFSISYFFLFFFAIFYNTISHNSYVEEIKYKVLALPNSYLISLMKKIDELVAVNKLYLEPDLSLLQISETLNEKERNISQAINTIQRRNVTDYINSLRIEHACNLLMSDKEKPVFEVMYESGFNTKGAFNLTFKKFTGKTPTQYREG